MGYLKNLTYKLFIKIYSTCFIIIIKRMLHLITNVLLQFFFGFRLEIALKNGSLKVAVIYTLGLLSG